MIIKCKMCGGDLNVEEGNPLCECEFCGTKQTVPQMDSEKKTNLFNRANRLRMNAEFDKAATVYASITAEFPEEAEAYWGLCLCKYGIEYVDDPLTGNKIPTCHRTLPESIMDDGDFDQACEYADPVAKRQYREEAKEIDRIQKGILDIVANEAPYDVFICYKETDEDGNRTEDSVLAQDIYDSLTGKGLKVFFARISLEDKLGKQYEPYIYAALHSAKVMVAIGTKYEYYDAVWVKNEWARFLDMMKTDRTKTLIPCYKDIDAYDIPNQFRNLQAQDMNKLGWLQDLIRGITKILQKDESKPTEQAMTQAAVSASAASAAPLLKRAFMFLEDGDFEKADDFFEQVLNLDPENSRAYLGKLLAEQKAKHEEELAYAVLPLVGSSNYQKAIRFGSDEEKKKLEGWNQAILDRNETNRQKSLKELDAKKQELEARKPGLETRKQELVNLKKSLADELQDRTDDERSLTRRLEEKGPLQNKQAKLKVEIRFREKRLPTLDMFQMKEKKTLKREIEEMMQQMPSDKEVEEEIKNLIEPLKEKLKGVKEDIRTLTEKQNQAKKELVEVEQEIVTIEKELGKIERDKAEVEASFEEMNSGATGTNEKKAGYNVVLKSAGREKVKVIKLVREVNPSLSLKEGVDFVDSVPGIIRKAISIEEALKIQMQFRAVGAIAELEKYTPDTTK